MKKSFLYSVTLLSTLVLGANAYAEDYVLTIQGNQFSPKELVLPADKKVKVIIKNLDATPAEFESQQLNIEKMITAKGEVILNVGPLKAGTYAFVEEYHEDVAKGNIVVK